MSSPRPPKVVAVLNQKGGVGKTTSTVNLGAALARAGRRVCLVDLDPQAHLTYHLGVESWDRTVYDLLVDPDCTAAEAVIAEARPNLDVLLAEVDLAAAETELASVANRHGVLREKFAGIADRYDVVLIDCPPSLGLLTLNALAMANEVFVPMQAHFLALQGVGRLLETVGLVCRSVNPDLRVTGIVLCMHEANTTLAKEIVADLDAFFEAAREQDVPWNRCRVLRPPIRRNIKLAEAPSFGSTIFDYAPWCPGALDYRRLATKLLEDWGFESGKRGGKTAKAAAPVVKAAAAAPSAAPVASTEPAAKPAPAAAPKETAPAPAPTKPGASVEEKPKPAEAAERAAAPEIVVPRRDASTSAGSAGERPADG